MYGYGTVRVLVCHPGLSPCCLCFLPLLLFITFFVCWFPSVCHFCVCVWWNCFDRWQILIELSTTIYVYRFSIFLWRFIMGLKSDRCDYLWVSNQQREYLMSIFMIYPWYTPKNMRDISQPAPYLVCFVRKWEH